MLAEGLVEKGFLLETRAVTTDKKGRESLIEVGNTKALEGELIYFDNSVNQYTEIIRQDRISWLLFDGSVLQIAYSLRGTVITSHRYCYVPSPFQFDFRDEPGANLLDLIDSVGTSEILNSPRRSSLRFEFDPISQTETHAAAHLHLNSADCRIPLRAPLTVKEFVTFIVKFLYNKEFTDEICGPTNFHCNYTITEMQESHFHISWRRSA